MKMENEIEETEFYAVVANIPPDYHSVDLRNYFSMFIEDGGFTCFHFRHRPEIIRDKNEATSTTSKQLQDPVNKSKTDDVLATLSRWAQAPVTVSKPKPQLPSLPAQSRKREKGTTCCVVKLKEPRLAELMRMYHRKHWLNREGDSVPALCQIRPVNTKTMPATNGAANKYKTRSERKSIPPEREEFTVADLEQLPELHPPDIMPNGNVGTPTKSFLQFIRECRMPPQVIAKLGLKFPRTRTNKIYSKVFFDYGGLVEDCPEPEEIVIKSADGRELMMEGDNSLHAPSGVVPTGSIANTTITKEADGKDSKGKSRKRKRKLPNVKPISDSEEEEDFEEPRKSDSDSDDCEDYERHEALHSDVAHHVERNKERLFECEIELKWEKGGSGLVFYTDAQYWDEQKGDFDERTADDWDVDMEVYTDHRAGDKDARDFILMRQETRRRAGKEATDMYTAGVGKFEKHTKGIGRRVMKQQGWAEGRGLGPSDSGISEALHNEGQRPWDRAGLGYLGEKLDHTNHAPKRRRQPEDVIISTIYDDPAETDPTEPLYRVNDHHQLSWRSNFLYAGTEGGNHKESGSKQ